MSKKEKYDEKWYNAQKISYWYCGVCHSNLFKIRESHSKHYKPYYSIDCQHCGFSVEIKNRIIQKPRKIPYKIFLKIRKELKVNLC